MAEPNPENVEGDFYVQKECCTLCEVPMIEAPLLFRYAIGDDGHADHCYVSQQPVTERELVSMVRAIECQEFECIRYRGNDPESLKRIADVGRSEVCDAIPRPFRRSPWWHFW